MEEYKLRADEGLYGKLWFVAIFVGVLWLVKSIELATKSDFYNFGVYPRTLHGITGIFTAPLIHGDIFHLLSNSIPLLVLTSLLFLMYRRVALDVFLTLYFSTGALLWLFGREAYHIGASGIVYGLFGYIFFLGLLLKQTKPMVVSMAIFFLYGGIFYGIFPEKPNISWESHLLGLIVGMALAVFTKSGLVQKHGESVKSNAPYNLSDKNLEGTIYYTYVEKSKREIEINQEEPNE